MTNRQTYVPIHCDLHDYIEIACLHRYQVKLDLIDGRSLRGLAITTRTADCGEFLVLETSKVRLEVRLDQLSTLAVLTEPRSFDSVCFT